MLFILDMFFNALHLFIIGFNLSGWIFRSTRTAHRWLVAATALCWLVIGPLMGTPGYCPITDWHWRIKEMRGMRNLPDSYIDYLLQLVSIHANPQIIDVAVGVTFATVAMLTLWLWQRDSRGDALTSSPPSAQRMEGEEGAREAGR